VGFIFKSLFWVGIVLLFLPRDPSALKSFAKTPSNMARISTSAVVDAASAGAGFCQARPEICESAVQTGSAGRDIVSAVATTLSGHFRQKHENPVQ